MCQHISGQDIAQNNSGAEAKCSCPLLGRRLDNNSVEFSGCNRKISDFAAENKDWIMIDKTIANSIEKDFSRGKIIGNSDFVMIDEAQRVNDIGLTLKMLADLKLNIPILVTGSSSFELNNAINEAATGRFFDYKMYPFSVSELAAHTSQRDEGRFQVINTDNYLSWLE